MKVRFLSLVIVSLMMLSCMSSVVAYGPGDIASGEITVLSNSKFSQYVYLTDDILYPEESIWHKWATDNDARTHTSIYDVSDRFTAHLNNTYLHCYYETKGGHHSAWLTPITNVDWTKGVFIDMNTYGSAWSTSIEILYYDTNGNYQRFYSEYGRDDT
ncbi:MAG: hypothetical protein LBC39_04275 [Methanobrevibacter sp.]|jgi:hypothetical protein|nr:hypothetical protein [Candidatus Methanovirga aequatorialis]